MGILIKQQVESVGFNPRTWILLPSIKKQSNASFVKIEHLFQKKKNPNWENGISYNQRSKEVYNSYIAIIINILEIR